MFPCMPKILKRLLIALMAGSLTVILWTYIPASTHYHIREAYSFRAGGQDAEIRLAVMIPTTGPYQEVRNVVITWDGTEAREPQGSVEVVKLMGRVMGGQEKVGTIAYDVILHQGRARWEGPTEDFQLQPQPGIESDAPALVQAASQIVTGRSRKDAYRIHKFTAGQLSWGGESGTNKNLRLQSALKAYENRIGVCGHFAGLMTALCRAAKIPAQCVSGLRLPDYPPLWSATRVWGSPAGTHGWVEFHTSKGWELADPSAAHRMPVKALSFGRNDGGRLSYGERLSHARICEAMRAWAGAKGEMVGAMSGPLRFAAAADGKVSCSPQATVKVVWSGRWFSLVVLVGLFVSGDLLQRRRQKRRGVAQQDAAPNSRPPSPLPTSPEIQPSDSQRTSSSGGCG